MSFRQNLNRLRSLVPFLTKPIWKGVYARLSDVPVRGPGFGGSAWMAESDVALGRLREKKSPPATLPLHVDSEHLLLPFLMSVLTGRQETVRVLDFGGGFGLSYQQILNCVPKNLAVQYHIVDQPEVCREAAKRWKDHPQLHFHENLPPPPFPVDVIFISSSLQYVEDYAGLLNALCRDYQAPYILFVKLSAGDIPTFVTAQLNLDGSVLPYRFINIQELIGLMRENRYSPVYTSTLDRTYDQANFPAKRRMGKAVNLLFTRHANS